MQSEDSPGVVLQPRPWPKWSNGVLPLLVFGVLPLLGFGSELLLGMLSTVLTLFPSVWHALAVGGAVVLNLLLHLGHFRTPSLLVPRALLVGFVAGMTLLYSLVELPAAPMMIIMAIVGLGILAAAPYFAAMGTIRLYADLSTCWRIAGRAPWQCRVWVSLGLLLPVVLIGRDTAQQISDVADMRALADAMGRRGDAAESERLAGRLRGGDLAAQRAICWNGVQNGDVLDTDLGMGRWNRDPFAHLGTGQPFWFVLRFRPTITADRARAAFHRAHGFAWNDPMWGPEDGGGDGRFEAIEWRDSRFTVQHEPSAALVRIDHEIELRSDARWSREAHFELRLPAGAVASSLSAWIDGHERPAAFGGGEQVQKAYDAVVQRNRDPVLLQEVAPHRLRLLMFPLGRDWPPMRVRIGYTVPLCLRGEQGLAFLPQVVSHNCAKRQPTHVLVIDGGAERQIDEAGLLQPLRFPHRDVVAVAKDADGFLVQRLQPRLPAAREDAVVVVLEASASVAAAVSEPARLLGAIGDGTPCALFLAHGEGMVRCDAPVGSPELTQCLQRQSFTGGVDPWPALDAAMKVAKERGIQRVFWLHGASAAALGVGRPELPEGVAIAALALHPGRHTLREDPVLRRRIVDVPRLGGVVPDLAMALGDALRFGATSASEVGEQQRLFERVAAPPPDAIAVSDQLARLWAAREARSAAYADLPGPARSLASRYRLVTGGVGAVVLERPEQYAAAGLDPGAEIGREPAGPIGSGPVPEPSTFVLLASGLAAVWWLRRKRAA